MGWKDTGKAIVGTAAVVAGAAGNPAMPASKQYAETQKARQSAAAPRRDRDLTAESRRRGGSTSGR